MKEVSVHEAETNLTSLLASVAEGEQIIISEDGKPLARLVPLNGRKTKRTLGEDVGKGWIAEDFDAPLPPDIQAAFEGLD